MTREPASATAGDRADVQSPNGNGEGEPGTGSHQGPGWSDGFSLGSEVIRFAPLSIPRHRRLQTFAVLFWALLLPIAISAFLLALSIPPLWPLIFIYLVWIYFDDAPQSGGRRLEWARRLSIWRYFAEYYPVSLIKSADLPPDKPYVFGYHPHGIIGMGAIANFATSATEFPTSFPGITPHLLTLNSNFNIPIYRDILMAMGLCSVSKRSCERILRKGKGRAITIVVGGASESLSAHPGTADLTLRRRLGFIKIAIRNGAALVPVFSFGENDIYSQLVNDEGTKVHRFQKWFQSIFGFTLPLFHGRGIWISVGLMPYRHPIVSVVGRPIQVKQNANPSKAELEEVQSRYIAELERIWEQWKDAYAANRSKELTIVD
ncbi:putative diacylglycerol acyltransferase type 2b [Acaromyces ingoldii]|uniref:Diacylglycerol O-acyltransferase n=1 Tax=Acaromyces ingoldii TaxID=215250 RepID=A0A316YSW0_9BASI|nr:putative diacylglycerol acyltransferase type 2b [Acaromyces ingoldii]PWN92497.1 putative diacylglycerol acyltransferase type 2b [Acaromyces ingoldii]